MFKTILNYISKFLPCIVFTLLCIVPIASFPLEGKDVMVLITFFINAGIFVFGITYAQLKYPFSIDMMVWTFMYFFMFFAPIVQYLYGVYPWSGAFTDSECLFANILISIFSIFFIIGKIIAKNIQIKKNPFSGANSHRVVTSRFTYNKTAQYLLIYVCCGLAAYSLCFTGFGRIVVSRDDALSVFYKGNNSSIALIIDIVIPAFLAYCTCEAAQDIGLHKKKENIIFAILVTCLVITFFPTAIPRYKAAAIYLTLGIIIFPWVQKHNLFFWAFVLALFFVFPIISSFRHELDITVIKKIFNGEFLPAYARGDYDAYRMLISTLRYVNSSGAVMGKQLAGVLLFFVPSALWANKPGGSGSLLITTELGPDAFDNVSCPYIAEGMLNFGIFGIILFALVLGFIAQKCDRLYWEDGKGTRKFAPYLFVIFLLFFLMRGDLLSSYAYLIGFIAVGVMLKIFRPASTKKKERYEYIE